MAERCPSCSDFENDRQPLCPLACMLDKCKSQRKPIVNIHHKPVIWVLGGPGSGRGTQCDLLKKKYGLTHLSTGDLLRAEVLSASERSKCLKSIMVRGGLVPNDIVLNLLREEMRKLESSSKGFLIDGFPREKHQGPAFERSVSPISGIIYLETTRETMLKRLKLREVQSLPRFDDTDEAFKLRIDNFLHYNKFILQQYKDKICKINAETSTIDEVFAEIQKYVNPIMEQAGIAFAAHTAALDVKKVPSKPKAPGGPSPQAAAKPTSAASKPK